MGHTEGLYVIRYDYPGTENGKPVGPIYVVRFWNGEVWCHSYTRNPGGATHYTEAEARDTLAGQTRHMDHPPHWPNATIVRLASAPVL